MNRTQRRALRRWALREQRRDRAEAEQKQRPVKRKSGR